MKRLIVVALLALSSCVRQAPVPSTREQACANAADPSLVLGLGQFCSQDGGGAQCIASNGTSRVGCISVPESQQTVCAQTTNLNGAQYRVTPCGVPDSPACPEWWSCRWLPNCSSSTGECWSKACLTGPACGSSAPDVPPYTGEWVETKTINSRTYFARVVFRADGTLDFFYRVVSGSCVIRDERVTNATVIDDGHMRMTWATAQANCVATFDACSDSQDTRCTAFMARDGMRSDYRMQWTCSNPQDRSTCSWSTLDVGPFHFTPAAASDGSASQDASASD